MNQHGVGLESMEQTKYNFEMPKEVIVKNITRLTNQIWKLIPMRENNEDWQKQLDTVIIQITGMYTIFLYDPKFLGLLSKLEGLKDETIEFLIYRKTVFEAITLLRGLQIE